MLVLKVVYSEWNRHTRDISELSAYQELGADVLILSRGEDHDRLTEYEDHGFRVLKLTSKPLKRIKSKTINRIAALLLWGRSIRSIHADVVDGHNLIGMAIAFFPYMLVPKCKRPMFIYDSHEYEMARLGGSALSKRIWAFVERLLIKNSRYTIQICDGIADELVRVHKLRERPVVIRSVPGLWTVDPEITRRRHDEITDRLGLPRGSFFVMYQGIFMRYRGLEELIGAMATDETIFAVWMGGYEDEGYRKKLSDLMQKRGVDQSRVLILPYQSRETMWEYTGAADCGIVMNNSKNPNYVYALPNKFFENIQSETPVICSKTIEMERLVKQYDIGLTVACGDAAALADAIKRMRSDKEMYDRFKSNLKTAKEELCWEKEKEVLKKAFREKILNT